MILGLEKPIRLRNKFHYFVYMEIASNLHKKVTLQCSEEERLAIHANLKAEYGESSPLINTIARLFRYVIGVNIIIPGDFKTSYGGECVNCTVNASTGLLYFLSKSIIWLYKPLIYVQMQDVAKATFYRVLTFYINFQVDNDI